MFSFLDTSLYGEGREQNPAANSLPSHPEQQRQPPADAQHLYTAQQQSQQQSQKTDPSQPRQETNAVAQKEQVSTSAESVQCHCGKDINTLAEVLQARISQAERRTVMMEARLLQVFEECKIKQTVAQGGCSWTMILVAVICLIALWIWSSRSDNSRAMDSASYPVMIPGGAPPSPMIVPIATAAGNIPTTFLRQ